MNHRTVFQHDLAAQLRILGVRYRRPKYAIVLEAGRPRRYDYAEIDHCCENFVLLT